jgi:hypothetical protein
MDIQSKLKHMYDRASKESFTHLFYKTNTFGADPAGENNKGETTKTLSDNESEEETMTEERFKQVAWFSHSNAQEPPSQGGVIELSAPMLPRKAGADGGASSSYERKSFRKLSTTHHLH